MGISLYLIDIHTLKYVRNIFKDEIYIVFI